MKNTGKMIRALLGGVLLLAFALVGQAAAQTWGQLTPTGTPPQARQRHSAVYDPTSNRMIVFGGQAPTNGCVLNPLNDTWVLTNANGLGGTPAWSQLAPSGSLPAARGDHGAGYDAVNDRMIVFGGDSTGCVPPEFNDVWVLSGASGTHGTAIWTQLATTGTPPPGLADPAVTYDPVNNKLIVFSGNTNVGNCGGEINGVWTLSNANGVGGTAAWTQLAPSGTAPAKRWYATAVFDANTDRMIAFGGGGTCSGTTTASGNDTWVLSGVSSAPAWTQLAPATLPPARTGHVAVYDAGQNAMTIFGGGTSLNDTWTLGAANGIGTPMWTQVSPSGTLPLARFRSSAVYDPATRRLTIFGGFTFTAVVLLNDVWVLTPSSAVCGNGIVEPGEQCDGGDCCSSSCQFKTAGSACTPDSNVCTLDVCNASGVCTHPAGNEGTTCSDGNACTTADHCSAGTCVGSAVTCNDNNACTTDSCDPALGCQHTPVADGTSLGQACTTGQPGVCSAGTQVCSGGTPSCTQNVLPSPEVCGDGLDNNCNGAVDENCFAAFTAKVEIKGDEFEVKATFTLGTGSNGIAPLTEDVKLQIGTFSTTIPAGSFKQNKKGKFKFEGVIGGVALEAVIQPLGGNNFEFKAEGEGANNLPTTNSVTVKLTIGDDSGSAIAVSRIRGREDD